MYRSGVLLLALVAWSPGAAGAPASQDTSSAAPEEVKAGPDGQIPPDTYNAALHSDEYSPCREVACEKPPRLLEGGAPVYPHELTTAGVEGSASIVFELDEAGRVVDPRVEHATHEAFGQSALQAVQGWRFAPAERDGTPVPVGTVRQVFPFRFVDPARLASEGKWGLVQARPIEVCKPEGQRRYLARLICPNDQHPEVRRLRSVGPRAPLAEELVTQNAGRWAEAMLTYEPLEPGGPDYHHVDEYELDCGGSKVRVYLDMYHCDVPPPDRAPEGLGLL